MKQLDDSRPLTPTGRKMARLVATQERSGRTIAAFAAEHGITPDAFYFWRRKLRLDRARSAGRRSPLVEATVVAEGEPAGAGGLLLVLLGRDRRIAVPAAFDAPHLRRLIAAVESC